ncbi:MAG: hypothetical protein EU532_04095 [Promethearchaeota archaeon]|nr:MAG: hypothetical protein EU532_04095 [Candidatus Lokiarchaeota archaeon]
MVEASKEVKIVLLINAIVALIYGFMYFIIPDITNQLNDGPYYNPQFYQLFGGTCFTLAIIALLAVKRGEWENLKTVLELGILWLIFVLIINFWSFAYMPYSTTAIASQAFDIIVVIIIIIVDIWVYLRESK